MFEPPTTERLIYLLRSHDPEARVDAARQLAERASDPVAHEALYEASFKRDQRIRAIAARALNDYPDDRTLIRLVDLLADRNSDVRLAAAEALRDLGDSGATLPLIEALSDRNRWVVLAAVAGLERFGSAAARRPLRKMIGSKDQGISQAARQALAAIEARDQ
ncbi:MAG TPA: HEAT repeat domain-containing protein [Caldilineae bacterium]|nr:HEAT repeat domain-containing protein [Caldilineae bacterium]